MVLGCNHPMGPLALADFIGLDTTMAAAESMYEEFKEPLFAPPPLLSRMVEAGLLGTQDRPRLLRPRRTMAMSRGTVVDVSRAVERGGRRAT